MRKLTLTLLAGATALAACGAAYAQAGPGADREMTRAQVEQRTAQAFGKMDANGDGKLDQADRQAGQKARFARVDTDHDGSVSYEEFGAMHAKFDGARAERGERRGERAGPREGRRMAMGGRHMRGMGQMADADKNGTITQAEFQAAAIERFDRLDADKNGTVTSEEHKAAREGMRQQMRERRAARADG